MSTVIEAFFVQERRTDRLTYNSHACESDGFDLFPNTCMEQSTLVIVSFLNH